MIFFMLLAQLKNISDRVQVYTTALFLAHNLVSTQFVNYFLFSGCSSKESSINDSEPHIDN